MHRYAHGFVFIFKGVGVNVQPLGTYSFYRNHYERYL